MTAPSAALLRVDELSVNYGAVHAVRDVSLSVSAGETVALLGANGAGKSSTLRAVMGLTPKRAGQVWMADRDISGKSPESLVRGGMTLVPEGRRVFAGLTVLENLRMGSQGRSQGQPVSGVPATPDEVYEMFPILGERRVQAAGTLSGGEQQQLAIARALMSRPRILLLDEPSLGLAPRLAEEVFELLRHLSDGGLTILLVEQNVNLALDVAERAYVMGTGVIRLEGTSAELRRSSGVERAYMGVVDS